MKDFHTAERECPYCKLKHDAALSIEGEELPPDDGDISICVGCVGVSKFEGLRLVKLTNQELIEAMQLPGLRRAVRILNEQRSKANGHR